MSKIRFFAIFVLVSVFLFNACSPKTSVPTAASKTDVPTALSKTGVSISTSNTNSPLFPAYSIIGGSKKWGYIDSLGKFEIKPQYDSASDFQDNNIAVVNLNNKYGLIDKQGNAIIAPSYDYITDYSEGYAVALKGSANSLINEKGKTMYSSTSPIYIMGFKSGMCLISKDTGNQTLYGYIDKTGKVKIDTKYLNAEPFNGDKALVKTSDNKYSLIDKNGNIPAAYDYSTLYAYSEDTIVYIDPSTKLSFQYK